MRLPLLLLLVLCTPLSWAQESPPAEQPPESAAGEDTPGQDASTASEASSPRPEPRGDSANNESPFEYEASEQISEDLSVSFPVDI